RGLLLHGTAVAAIVLVRAVYIYALDPYLHWYETAPAFADVLLQSVWNNLFQAWLFVGVGHALYFAARAAERERQAAQLQQQLTDARLSALSSQLNPHFLFNALNSIAELVHRDAAAADSMIVGLSALLRNSLEAVAPEARAALVPPLLLQPLVENAVRHGISRRLGAGTIRVLAMREGAQLRLEVHDDGA